jgi:hypothetical protein
MTSNDILTSVSRHVFIFSEIFQLSKFFDRKTQSNAAKQFITIYPKASGASRKFFDLIRSP